VAPTDGLFESCLLLCGYPEDIRSPPTALKCNACIQDVSLSPFGDDTVVHDEDRLSYVSATDYKVMLRSVAPELGQQHDELIHNQQQVQQTLEGQREEFSMTQTALKVQVEDLEELLRQQQSEMEYLREEESAAARERDQLQHICQQLQQQVGIQARLVSATPMPCLQCCNASVHLSTSARVLLTS
jgi:hypothetical protein